MNFNLNTLSSNYVSSQFSLNKLLSQQQNGMGGGAGVGNASAANVNLAPRFLAMNNAPNGQSNQPANMNANSCGNGQNLGKS